LTNPSFVRALAFSADGTKLFAGTDGGIFLSTDNGTSWTAVNTGLTNTTVHALAVSGANLYAGTEGGVFLSTDNGTSWTAVNTGLTNTTVLSLAPGCREVSLPVLLAVAFSVLWNLLYQSS